MATVPKIKNLEIDIIDEYRKITTSTAKRRANEPFLRTQSARRQFGQKFIDTMEVRTKSGIDKDGVKFRSYTPEYAKAKGISRSQVDLSDTDLMLNSLAFKATGATGIEIFIKNANRSRVANVHHLGLKPAPKRDFWGLPKREIKEIINSVLRTTN